MENVLNARERSYAYGIFLVSFVLTVAVIVGAVFFHTLVSKQENAELREEIADFKNQESIQEQFIGAMESIKILNDSLKKLGIVHPLIEREIGDHLKVMRDSNHQKGHLYGTINQDVFNLLYEYTEMNTRLLRLDKDLKDVEVLKNDLNVTKSKLEEAERSLDAYRTSSNLGIK